MSTKVLITGSKGQLGNEIRMIADSKPDWEFFYTDVEEVDITSQEAVHAFLDKYQPEVLVNCAGYTAVDKAEGNRNMAELINAKAVQILASECSRRNIFMVHVSTDFVFDGEKNTPYVEADFPNPKSVYALSKFHGEQAFLEHASEGCIVRTSWLYSSFGHNFVKTMMKLGKERDELGVVYDQVGTPTYAADLASAILKLIGEKRRMEKLEIFHYSNEGVSSWYDFSVAVMEYASLDCRVKPLLAVEYPLPAFRPHYSVMNKKKIREFLGCEIPHWRESLRRCVDRIEN